MIKGSIGLIVQYQINLFSVPIFLVGWVVMCVDGGVVSPGKWCGKMTYLIMFVNTLTTDKGLLPSQK